MGRTLPSVCVVILSIVGSLGQEAFQSQTTTDAPANVDWDTTNAPLSEPNAQSQSDAPTPIFNQDYETIFSNPWGPMMMQMNLSPYGDRLYNGRSRFETQGNSDVNPFLRRPDAYYPRDWNDTVPQDYERYSVLPDYQPYPPQGVFYPQTENSDRNPNNVDLPDQLESTSDQQDPQSRDDSKPPTDPAISQPPPFYIPPFSRQSASRDQQFYYPPMNYFWGNQDIRGRANTARPTPYPYPPGFYPPGGPPTYPQVNVFVQPPNGEDKSALTAPEQTAERRQSVPEPLSPPVPASNNLPVPSYPPRPNLPFPLNPYLFGYPPFGFRPPFVPELIPRPTPILPNIPPPNNNLIDIPTQDLLRPPKREDLPPLPPPKHVPDVVNVDVIGPSVADTKPAGGNIPYSFGYDINDGLGTEQQRQESSDASGVKTGSYSYTDLNGVYRIVNYIADKDGYRVSMKTNEPGAANPGSADVVVLAERPPLKIVVEGLKRSNVEVAVASDQSEMEIE
ncbi:hypothetical protein JTE90_025324 [Oedothorax gibbosus]|uniref:Cuticle protein n=1 Tax=Oedothorax gibbosus TaxID=931172 RepID=A0AAV6V5Q8_9ARAC|nr:hypothetical protein JTE90_025324 [Oedothorax gibbosus]